MNLNVEMFYLAIYLAKTINRFIQTFKIGTGNVWPGHIALKIYPNLFKHPKVNFKKGMIFITGTNGKTTTAKILTHVLSLSNYKVAHNKSGANLLNGIASTILLDMSLFGTLKSDLAVFEVDEFTLPTVLSQLTPHELILLNLSRDQLDRYGEVDIIYDRWKKSLESLPSSTIVIADKNQELFKSLPNSFKGSIYWFDDNEHLLKKTSLHGKFNAKNLNASSLALQNLGITQPQIEHTLKSFQVAYGRGELISYKNKRFQMFLAKNPASFNHNIDLLDSGDILPDTLLFVLNDNIPDGRDVSWIYDINAENLQKACENKKIYVSGTRSLDMAIRLKYAGTKILDENVSNDLNHVFNLIMHSDASHTVVLPNYSAMLESRKILVGRSIL